MKSASTTKLSRVSDEIMRSIESGLLRVDQFIGFTPLPEAPARALGLQAGQPGFMMELRAYTLRDRPISYQCVYSGPLSERLVVVR
ncbi:hypothetical protein LP414_23340 [Polaromonas sp. P1(28)-13]|nr:hypothetical protein LP414_23340 [Polaromonas sp. P1(28)-13]